LGEEFLGLEYGEALARARPCRVLFTRPGLKSLGKGRLLVVGQRVEATGLTLIFAYTDYERWPQREH
jgi:hypothetical protein